MSKSQHIIELTYTSTKNKKVVVCFIQKKAYLSIQSIGLLGMQCNPEQLTGLAQVKVVEEYLYLWDAILPLANEQIPIEASSVAAWITQVLEEQPLDGKPFEDAVKKIMI